MKQRATIGILDAYIGEANPGVMRVLPDLKLLSFPIWMTAHQELTTSRRIRRVYDFLIKELKR